MAVPLVVSDSLCFIVNKYGKVSVKTLKIVLLDFYTAEELSTAKFRLCDDIDKLDTTLKRPHVAQRRDVDTQSRLNKEVDDILQLFTFVDENKLTDKLPKYVASSPDKMPSLRLYDGDMNVILNLLHAMNKRLLELESGLSAITGEIHSLRQAAAPPDWPHLSAQSAAVLTAPVGRNVNKSSKTVVGTTTDRSQAPTSVSAGGDFVPVISTETETIQSTSSTAMDWATLTSTPLLRGNRYAVLSSDDVESCGNREEPFKTVARRHKRGRQQTTPQQQQHQQQQQQSSTAEGKPIRAARLLGKNADARGGSLKAAKKIYRKKAIFCVDNVDLSCTVDELCSFVSNLVTEVYSCFEVKSRRRRNEEDSSSIAERKAFRLCIPDDDRDKLLNAAVWPDSVIVSEWYFRSSKEESEKRRRITSGNVAEAVNLVTLQSLSSSSSARCSSNPPAAAAAATAVVVTETASVDGSDAAATLSVNDGNTTTSSDNTILAAYNLSDG